VQCLLAQEPLGGVALGLGALAVIGVLELREEVLRLTVRAEHQRQVHRPPSVCPVAVQVARLVLGRLPGSVRLPARRLDRRPVLGVGDLAAVRPDELVGAAAEHPLAGRVDREVVAQRVE
jgi:hypothetical protein